MKAASQHVTCGGQASGWVAATRLICSWTPEESRGAALGALAFSARVGTVWCWGRCGASSPAARVLQPGSNCTGPPPSLSNTKCCAGTPFGITVLSLHHFAVQPYGVTASCRPQIGFMAGGGLLGLMLLNGFNWQALFYAVSALAVLQSLVLFALVPADSPYSLSPATEDAEVRGAATQSSAACLFRQTAPSVQALCFARSWCALDCDMCSQNPFLPCRWHPREPRIMTLSHCATGPIADPAALAANKLGAVTVIV
jgi:hypothetical protein